MRLLIACVIIGLGLLIALSHCKKKENRSMIQRTKEKVADCSQRWINKGVIFFPLPVLLATCREKINK
jgi:hypothetical protein